eukprot:scaffold2246_cov215-Pinguiococcus_pyrenoidosus.AAC.4
MLRRSMVWRLFTRSRAMRTVRGVCFGCHKGVVHRPECALQQLGRGLSSSSAEPVDPFPKLRKELKDNMDFEDSDLESLVDAWAQNGYRSDNAVFAMAKRYFAKDDKAGFRADLALISEVGEAKIDVVATACFNILDHEARTSGTSQMPCLELCRDAVRPNRSHEDHAI